MRFTINSNFNWRFVVVVFLIPLLLPACSNSPFNSSKVFTIGVLIQGQNLTPVLDGFKSGLTQLGYEEGKTVVYVYDGPTGTV